MTISIREHTFRLLPQKALFWEEESCLIISDLHLGKSGHFRKGGVPLPGAADRQNLRVLSSLIEVIRPSEILLLGDLFHSERNRCVDEAGALLAKYPSIRKTLVAGNHDILEKADYKALTIEVVEGSLVRGPFVFAHEPIEVGEEPGSGYRICGHVHPGVRLNGKGRQSLILPCFYFSPNQAILPAFGVFTGTHPIQPGKGDRIFAIVEKSIIPIAEPSGEPV